MQPAGLEGHLQFVSDGKVVATGETEAHSSYAGLTFHEHLLET